MGYMTDKLRHQWSFTLKADFQRIQKQTIHFVFNSGLYLFLRGEHAGDLCLPSHTGH